MITRNCKGYLNKTHCTLDDVLIYVETEDDVIFVYDVINKFPISKEILNMPYNEFLQAYVNDEQLEGRIKHLIYNIENKNKLVKEIFEIVKEYENINREL